MIRDVVLVMYVFVILIISMYPYSLSTDCSIV